MINKLRQVATLKNLLQVLCISLTVFLVYQELENFLVTKPTSTSLESRELDDDTFPEVTVCLDPALDAAAARRHGYQAVSYYRGGGGADGSQFVGWTGGAGGGSLSSVLDSVLTVGAKDRELVRADYGVRGLASRLPGRTGLTHPVYPYGRCIQVSTLLCT
jgi:hypothetical protein